MSANRDLLPLLVILESIGKIQVYVNGFQTAEDFLWAESQVRFNASLLLLSNIGEYVKKISDETRDAYPTFPWKKVRALRNRIAHDYTGIDYERVFDIIQNHLLPLKRSIEIIIKEGFEKRIFDRNECEVAKNSVFYKHVNFEIFDT